MEEQLKGMEEQLKIEGWKIENISVSVNNKKILSIKVNTESLEEILNGIDIKEMVLREIKSNNIELKERQLYKNKNIPI